jgi:hypothetical protein
MSTTHADRERVRQAREHLPEWTFDARSRAYTDLFEGPEAVVTDDELGLLDRIDSALSRRGQGGLWGVDEYGVVVRGALGDAVPPGVVCTYHPEIPSEGFRGEGSLDETTRERLNDVLWDYCERVATYLQDDLDAFLRTPESTPD